MSERQNTVVCSFDPKSPRISAVDIHEWIFEQLRVPENVLTMVQIDVTRRQVYCTDRHDAAPSVLYIKFNDFQYLQDLLHSATGLSEYKHDNGEISQVKIEMAGMGTRRVRLANIPPETPDEAVSFESKESNPGRGRDIPQPSRLTLWPTQPPIQWVPRLFTVGELGWGVALITHHI